MTNATPIQRAAMNLRELLINTMDQFPAAVQGLVVHHRGYQMQLMPSGDRWTAYAWVVLDVIEDHEVEGYGATPREALDACADEADLAGTEDELAAADAWAARRALKRADEV